MSLIITYKEFFNVSGKCSNLEAKWIFKICAIFSSISHFKILSTWVTLRTFSCFWSFNELQRGENEGGGSHVFGIAGKRKILGILWFKNDYICIRPRTVTSLWKKRVKLYHDGGTLRIHTKYAYNMKIKYIWLK